jgi:Fe-S-cluster containining protein
MLKKNKLPVISKVARPAKVKQPKVMKPVMIDDPISYMKKSFRKNGKSYTTFLRGLLHRKVRGLDAVALSLNKLAFKKIDCLKCANCCKTMSPTYKKADVKRIAKHLNMSFQDYYDKYLEKDEDSGDYMNKSTPCQFLKKDNMCSIYPVRPKDCSGFPHTQWRDFKLYISGTHIQNIEYCPITHHVVERMHEIIIKKGLRNLSAKSCEENVLNTDGVQLKPHSRY